MPYAEESLIIKSDDSRKALISSLLGLRKRFSSKSGLVDGHIDGLRKTTISRDNVTNFEGNHVTRDEIRRLDFRPDLLAMNLALGSNRPTQCLYRSPSILL